MELAREWPPDTSEFDRRVARFVGSALGTVALLALLWWAAASLLGDYRDWTGWNRIWFVGERSTVGEPTLPLA